MLSLKLKQRHPFSPPSPRFPCTHLSMNPKSIWIKWPSSSSRMLPLCLQKIKGEEGTEGEEGTACHRRWDGEQPKP